MTPEEAQRLVAGAAAADSAVAGELGPGAENALGELEHVQDPDQAKAAHLVALEAENKALLETALAAIAPMLPFLPQIYTADVIDKIAKAGAAVEQKYNVSVLGLFGKYKEEAMLAIAVLPPTVTAIAASRVYFERQKKAAAAAASSSSSAPAPAPADGAEPSRG
ncbi:MAG TPA: hypothetical protein VED01_07765 [Burkholderiales bacterium]|nr:hypothetical protein [Burkholderiales bacterium]